MSNQEYFKTRQEVYEKETTNRVKNNILTRRLQVSGVNKQFVIGVPKSIIKCLDLHEQDLFKIQLTENGVITMKRVNLDNE